MVSSTLSIHDLHDFLLHPDRDRAAEVSAAAELPTRRVSRRHNTRRRSLAMDRLILV